jgi:hypothetical protein
VGQFTFNVHKNDDGRGKANCKTKNGYQCISQVPSQVSYCGYDVVPDHPN